MDFIKVSVNQNIEEVQSRVNNVDFLMSNLTVILEKFKLSKGIKKIVDGKYSTTIRGKNINITAHSDTDFFFIDPDLSEMNKYINFLDGNHYVLNNYSMTNIDTNNTIKVSEIYKLNKIDENNTSVNYIYKVHVNGEKLNKYMGILDNKISKKIMEKKIISFYKKTLEDNNVNIKF